MPLNIINTGIANAVNQIFHHLTGKVVHAQIALALLGDGILVAALNGFG